MSVIPLFIIVHNQYDILKKSFESYEKFIKYPIKIIFHNVASTYQPTLDFLNQKEKEGYTIYNSNINNHLTVMDSIKDYLSKNKECKYYILTDPDIELFNVNENILKTYIYLLEKYNVYSVGPMLKIDDIPDYYPKKNLVFKRHNRFYKAPRINEEFESNKFEIVKEAIDTTFQLISVKNIDKNFPHNNCIRVFEPYNARHLDWYIDPNNMTDCQKYYFKTTTNISHWNNKNWNGKN